METTSDFTRMFNPAGNGGDYPGVCCPFCEFTYVKVMHTAEVPGNDNYEAGWGGRGDLTMVAFEGECGSKWILCFGFHKGCTDTFLTAIADCRGAEKKNRAIDYHEYIRSDEWREKAEAAKERAGQRCQVCNRTRSEIVLDTHHRTYERLGNEDSADLIVLCRDCHGLFHKNGKLAR